MATRRVPSSVVTVTEANLWASIPDELRPTNEAELDNPHADRRDAAEAALAGRSPTNP